jgi:hypothetical protein
MAQDKRKRAEERLLLSLVCGATVEAAARQCGLHEKTVRRRLAEPAFRRRLQELRTEMVVRTAGSLTAASTESVRTLLELQKPATPASVRLGAARTVLELGIKLREAADLESRVAALEEQLALSNGL